MVQLLNSDARQITHTCAGLRQALRRHFGSLQFDGLKELALLEQPYIKDSSLTVSELVKQVAGILGENIQVRRFTRYTLGEGIAVEKLDFAAEVAAMTV